jgi:hypothetical protein
MAPRTLAPSPGQRTDREPLFDVHPQTGTTIEVFYADRTLETFGRCGAGWFWCSRRRGCSPDSPATGPFATSYAAYRHAMNAPAAIYLDDAAPFREVVSGQDETDLPRRAPRAGNQGRGVCAQAYQLTLAQPCPTPQKEWGDCSQNSCCTSGF